LIVPQGSSLQVEEGRPKETDPSDTPYISKPSPVANPFRDFALTCSQIAGDPRKLEKIRFLAEYLRGLDGEAIGIAATWFSGLPFPASQNKRLQIGWAVLSGALRSVAGIDEAAFHKICLAHSDAGEVAFELLQTRQIDPTLSIQQVNEFFHKLHAARGPLAKTPILIDALQRCSAMEAKYLVKIITGDLRIGLKEGLVEEAIASSFAKPAQAVRQANLLLGDIGQAAKLAAQNRLAEATLVPFRPIKFMLASPEPTATALWERIQSRTAVPTISDREQPVSLESSIRNGEALKGCPTVWLEDKYDGIRCQLHKVGRRVSLYSRDLKEITTTFLELTDSVRAISGDYILDGEVVAMRGGEVVPFAELQKRLGRRQGDLFLQQEVPIKFMAFDLLWLNGQSYLDHPLRQRREALESLVPPAVAESSMLSLARTTQAHSADEIEAAFNAARQRGNEGLMIKNPNSLYTPGRRGLAWLKLKKAFATLDCAVIGVEYGHGKRNKVLSDYTFAVSDEATGELKTIGKAYSGLTDVEIAQLTEHFFSKAVRQHGRYFEVEPDTILEIAFDKIQPSTRHSSGLAMRFPRILRVRTDKSITEIDTLATARKLAGLDAG
jgi:DNA ligase-1